MFFRHSPGFANAAKYCFPYLADAASKCQVQSKSLDEAYSSALVRHGTEGDDDGWMQSPKLKRYIALYESARRRLVQACKKCVEGAVPAMLAGGETERHHHHHKPPALKGWWSR